MEEKDARTQIGKIISQLRTQAQKNGRTLTAREIYRALGNYFGDPSRYKKDQVPRYIYSNNQGWIDLYHVFRAAEEAQKSTAYFTFIKGLGVEVGQTLSIVNLDSAFTIEDLSSNLAGIALGSVTRKSTPAEISSKIDKLFLVLDAASPQDDPNYNKLSPIYSDSYFARTYKFPWPFPTKAPDWWI